MEELLNLILFNPTVGSLVAVFAGMGIIWVVIHSVQRNLLIRIKDADNRYRAKKFSSFVGFLLTVVLISVVFSDRLGGLTVAFGVAGAGIAFALQEVIASFAGWLAILFGGFYKSGDRVQLGGIKGDVMDIGVLRTTVMEIGQWVDADLYNGRIVLIANSFVFKEPVYNYSGEYPFLWDEIKVPVQYGSNYEMARQILLQIGHDTVGDLPLQAKQKWALLQDRYLLEQATTDPTVFVVANDNWVELTLRYVVDYKRRRVTKTALFTQVLQKIEATGGAVRFASATFHLTEAPEIRVRVNH